MALNKYFLTLLILIISTKSYTQNDTIQKKYFSIGTDTKGIAFGNPNIYNGVKLDLVASGEQMNGVQLNLFASHTNKINGFSINLINHGAEKINGFAASFMINSNNLNGVFAGFGIGSPKKNIENRSINGVPVGVLINAEKLNGLIIALGNSYSKQMTGISISLFNQTENLHGLQIGLINYAGNNPKLLRWLPFFNFHK